MMSFQSSTSLFQTANRSPLRSDKTRLQPLPRVSDYPKQSISITLDEEQLLESWQAPEELKSLLKKIKERENILLQREKDFENEVQRRLQNYLSQHGLLMVETDSQSQEDNGSSQPQTAFFSLTQVQPTVSNGLASSSTKDISNPLTTTTTDTETDMSAGQLSPIRGSVQLMQSPLSMKTVNNSPSVLGKIKGAKASPAASLSPTKNRKSSLNPHCDINGDAIKSRLQLDADDPNKDKIHDFVDIIVNNIQKGPTSNGTAENMGLIKMIAPKQIIKMDTASDTSDLPLSFGNGSEVTNDLKNAEIMFPPPPVHRGASQDIRERDWFKIHYPLIAGIAPIYQDCNSMMPMIKAIERILDDLIHFVKTFRQAGITRVLTMRKLLLNNTQHCQHLQQSLADLFKILGDLQAREITNHSKLFEYRSFFESYQRSCGGQSLKLLFKDFPEFEQCFHSFTFCQGCVFDVHKRLMIVKENCEKYEVLQLLIASPSNKSLQHQEEEDLEQNGWGSFYPSTNSPNGQSIGKDSSEALVHLLMQQGGNNIALQSNAAIGRLKTANDSLEHYAQRLEEELVASEQEIKVCEREIEDLEQELLNVMKERDKTPGAILFFSLLHDSSFVTGLQQLSLQLTTLKGFIVHQNIDMDFMTLRKRMQVCLNLVPTVDKIIERYGVIYKQWASHRIQYFAERKLRGNAADNLTSCPLCFHDLSNGSHVSGHNHGDQNNVHQISHASQGHQRSRKK